MTLAQDLSGHVALQTLRAEEMTFITLRGVRGGDLAALSNLDHGGEGHVEATASALKLRIIPASFLFLHLLSLVGTPKGSKFFHKFITTTSDMAPRTLTLRGGEAKEEL